MESSKTGPAVVKSRLFPDCDSGTSGGCASCVGTSPLPFRDTLPEQVLRAQPTIVSGQGRQDVTFRQNGQHDGIFRSNSPLLALVTCWAGMVSARLSTA